jgi:hypothetical protein
MAVEPQDYFLTTEHENRVKLAIEREQARLQSVANLQGPLPAISDALGALTTYTSWFSQIGLKDIAIQILEDEAKRLKKKS